MSEFEEFTPEQLGLIRTELLPADTSDGEFALFVEQCRRSQLDPFSRQIMGTPGYSKGRFKLTIVTTIDGFRLIADRTGKYDGQTEQEWCGPDGAWRTVWLEDNPPAAARCGVYRKGTAHPSYAVMTWAESPGPGSKSPVWRSMPAHMLSKCAEALALRKAFPNDLSGLYTSDELPPGEPTPKAGGYKPEDLPNPHAYSLDEQDSLHEIAEENRLAREQETVEPEDRTGLLKRVKSAKVGLSDEAFGVLRDGLIEDGALLDSGHMPDPLPAEAFKAADRRLLVAATPAPSEPLEVDESGGPRRWMKAEVMAHTPDGWTEDRYLEALLVKANAMRPEANKGAGFESWRDLQKHPVLVAELVDQTREGTLEDLQLEPFDA